MSLEQNIEAIKSLFQNRGVNNKLIHSYFNTEEDTKKVKARIAEKRHELDKKTGADKIEQPKNV